MTNQRIPRQVLLLAVCLLLAGMAAWGASPIVNQPVKFAISPPMTQVPQAPGVPQFPTIIPVHANPNSIAGGPDGAVQTNYGPLLAANPGIQFDGVDSPNDVCNCAPPDTNMAVGPNHIVSTVNTAWAVYDKSGNIFPGFPKSLGSIWNAIGAPCNGNWGDVVGQYDKVADRWVITQLGSFSAPFFECVAVSTTNDPTGSYALYSYSFGNNLPDYPKWGVWPTSSNPAYLASYNLFANAASYLAPDICAYDRTAMLAGNATATQVCFQLASSEFTVMPSDLDGSTIPPAGSPGYFLDLFNTTSLHLYGLTPNFANPNSSTLTGPTSLTVASYSAACNGGTCIPQSGTSQRLDSLADRMMYRLAYRNYGDHEAAVINHSVTSGGVSGIRWYEIRGLSTSPTVFQQGTFQPDTTYRWMGSIAMDKAGDIAVGYSTSSSSLHPGIAYTGRVPSDPSGTLESEITMFTGAGSQTAGLSRWGDYSAMRIDPADDCTFWYTQEYIPSNGTFNWNTRIGSFVFPNCNGQPMPDFSISATPPSQTITRGQTATYTATITPIDGFTSDVNLTVTGLPKLTTATFSPNPVTGGSGTSTLTITTKKFLTKVGTYTLTITGTSGSLSHSTQVTLTISKTADDNAPDDPGAN